jgi:alpha-ketoglutarate-dependent taurine dioxygenase
VKNFDQYTNQFGNEHLIHGSIRKKINAKDTIQDVTKGQGKVLPHIEMGRMPTKPNQVWFLSEKPALIGGESTLVDGIKVAESLPDHVRNFFRDNPISFQAKVSKFSWQRLWGIQTLSELKDRMDMLSVNPNISFEMNEEDESFIGRYSTSAFITQPDGKLAFSNSIVGPYEGPSGGECRMLNGNPIPSSIIETILNCYQYNMNTITMDPGDFMVVNNHRFMHGREAFRVKPGDTRKMYAKLIKGEFHAI